MKLTAAILAIAPFILLKGTSTLILSAWYTPLVTGQSHFLPDFSKKGHTVSLYHVWIRSQTFMSHDPKSPSMHGNGIRITWSPILCSFTILSSETALVGKSKNISTLAETQMLAVSLNLIGSGSMVRFSNLMCEPPDSQSNHHVSNHLS